MQATILHRLTPGSGQTLVMGGQASCGFPSPATDSRQPELSLDELVGLGPRSSLFLVRASGESMRDKGIFDNDVLVVDKARPGKEGQIVIAVIDSEFLVKKIERLDDGTLALVSGNRAYPPLKFTEEQTVMIWGVCVWNLHSLLGDQ